MKPSFTIPGKSQNTGSLSEPRPFPAQSIPSKHLTHKLNKPHPNSHESSYGCTLAQRKTLHQFSPIFGTDHTAHSRPLSSQACILMPNSTPAAHFSSGQSRPTQKIPRKFPQFGPMFWDRSNGPSRPQTNRNIKKNT